MRAWTTRRASLIGFAVSAALFVGIGGFAVSRIIDLGAANAAVEHTLLVRAQAEELMSLLEDAETGQRGYVITGLPRYLEPYNAAVAALPARVVEFRRLTADNAAQQQNVTAFEGVAQRRIAILRDGIAARQERGFESAAEVVRNGEGMRVMNSAREIELKMVAEEDRLWRERGLARRERSNAVALAGLGGLAVAFVLLVIATFFVAKS